MQIERTISLPTREVEVLQPIRYGGRVRKPYETLWMTESDVAAFAGAVRTLRTVPSHSIAERISLARDRLGL
jgi:hypothetical protein